MGKYLIVFMIVLSFSACSKVEKESPITLNGIEISAEEFNDAYQASMFSKKGIDGKKEFLETFISRKLILLQAEAMGLDKSPDFLADIQLFWEQSLLKRVLSARKMKIVDSINVDEKDIAVFYNNHSDTAFADRSLDDVRDQIEQILRKEGQQAAIAKWIDSLTRDADIKVDNKKLGIIQ